MSVAHSITGAIHPYLEELELQLKRHPGVSPEEALSDARKFLMADASALVRFRRRSGPSRLVSKNRRRYLARLHKSPINTPATLVRKFGRLATHHEPKTQSRCGQTPTWANLRSKASCRPKTNLDLGCCGRLAVRRLISAARRSRGQIHRSAQADRV